MTNDINDTQVFITWTPAMLAEFKREYAKHAGQDATFTFDGNEYAVGYAKYLVEFLETVFGSKGA